MHTSALKTAICNVYWFRPCVYDKMLKVLWVVLELFVWLLRRCGRRKNHSNLPAAPSSTIYVTSQQERICVSIKVPLAFEPRKYWQSLTMKLTCRLPISKDAGKNVVQLFWSIGFIPKLVLTKDSCINPSVLISNGDETLKTSPYVGPESSLVWSFIFLI